MGAAAEESSLKAYLINLERSADRLAHMREELGRAGVAFERLEAVDGAALDADVAEAFRAARTAAKPEGWLPGEIGCFLSHMEVWKRVAEGDDAWAAVFEDDIHVSTKLGSLLGRADWIPANADVIRLEGGRSMRLADGRSIPGMSGRRIYRARSGTAGAAAYCVAKATARKLAETTPAHHTAADLFLFKPKASSIAASLRRYQVVPAVCVQDGVAGGEVRLPSEIKPRGSRGRGYREKSHPLLRLWPIRRLAVPFRP